MLKGTNVWLNTMPLFAFKFLNSQTKAPKLHRYAAFSTLFILDSFSVECLTHSILLFDYDIFSSKFLKNLCLNFIIVIITLSKTIWQRKGLFHPIDWSWLWKATKSGTQAGTWRQKLKYRPYLQAWSQEFIETALKYNTRTPSPHSWAVPPQRNH